MHQLVNGISECFPKRKQREARKEWEKKKKVEEGGKEGVRQSEEHPRGRRGWTPDLVLSLDPCPLHSSC